VYKLSLSGLPVVNQWPNSLIWCDTLLVEVPLYSGFFLILWIFTLCDRVGLGFDSTCGDDSRSSCHFSICVVFTHVKIVHTFL
jgi:hypothetical protein